MRQMIENIGRVGEGSVVLVDCEGVDSARECAIS